MLTWLACRFFSSPRPPTDQARYGDLGRTYVPFGPDAQGVARTLLPSTSGAISVDKCRSRPLEQWYRMFRQAEWQSLQEVRLVYPHADPATVASGNTVTVFNIGGNKYRLIAT